MHQLVVSSPSHVLLSQTVFLPSLSFIACLAPNIFEFPVLTEFPLGPSYSKYSPQTSSSIPWTLVGRAESQAPPGHAAIRIYVWHIDMHIKVGQVWACPGNALWDPLQPGPPCSFLATQSTLCPPMLHPPKGMLWMQSAGEFSLDFQEFPHTDDLTKMASSAPTEIRGLKPLWETGEAGKKCQRGKFNPTET